MAVLVLVLLAPQEAAPVRVAWGPVGTVDPALAIAPQDVRVADALFEGLAGAAATTSGAVVTFTLADRTWSDGKPVTASDYRFAWIRCLRPSTGSPWAFRFRHIKGALAWHESEALGERLLLYDNEGAAGREAIAQAAREWGTKRHATSIRELAEAEKDEKLKSALQGALESCAQRADLDPSSVGIEAVDARRLRVTLESPRPGFAELAATTPFRPVPEHVVTAKHDQWTHPTNLVTCGSYGVEKWTRQDLVLKRTAAAEGIARIALVPSGVPGEVWPLYERGLVEWIEPALVPADKIEALAAAGEIRSVAGSSVVYLRLNPEAKAGLRRAIALAVDRAPLVKKASPGSAETRSLIGTSEGPAHDLVGALAALTVDYPDLKVPRVRLLAWKGSSGEEIARAVRAQLEETLALSVRFDLREGPSYFAAVASGDFDAAVASFSPEAGDPAGALDLFPGGRSAGEKKLLDDALVIPLLREGEWFAVKPRIQATPGLPLAAAKLKP
jgi:ABC-type oligopeptide transport system substrate-binding subunit